MRFRLMSATSAALVLVAVSAAAQQPPSCKPVEHHGVRGCEVLPDQTCPPGYHKEAVGPPNPKMAGPTYLMCVPDKPHPKEQPPAATPKSSRWRP